MTNRILTYNVLFKGIEFRITPVPRIFSNMLDVESYVHRVCKTWGLDIKSTWDANLSDKDNDYYYESDLYMDYRCEDSRGNSFYFVIYRQWLDLDDRYLASRDKDATKI